MLLPLQSQGSVRVQAPSTPSVHRGFLQRARSINIAALQQHARMRGLRLVLCGAQSALLTVLCIVYHAQEPPHGMPAPNML